MKRADLLQRQTFEDIDARCVWVQLDGVMAEVLARAEYPAAVAEQIGRMLLIAAAMSSGLKFNGRITVQMQSAGPVSLLMADCDDSGGLRALARIREGAEPSEVESAFERLAGAGTLTLTLEPADQGQRWQGIVPLEGSSLEQAIERYFERSEQLPTRFRLAVDGQRACGLMIQKLPDRAGDEDGWNRLNHLIDTLGHAEMLDNDGERVLHRLFHAEARRAHPSRDLHFHCPCTRERVAAVLQSLGADEVRSLAEEQPVVEVRCEFCNEAYRFDQVDLRALIQGGPSDDSTTVH